MNTKKTPPGLWPGGSACGESPPAGSSGARRLRVHIRTDFSRLVLWRRRAVLLGYFPLRRQRGSRGCPPGTLPCLQGTVCDTCRPRGYGNGGTRQGKAPSATGWEKAPGLAGKPSQRRPPAGWYTIYLRGRYCQPSHSPLWVSHHAGNAGSFGERVGLIGAYSAVPLASALKSVNSFTAFEIPK